MYNKMDNLKSKKAMTLFLLNAQRKNAEKSPLVRAVAPKTVRDAIAEFVAVKPVLPKR